MASFSATKILTNFCMGSMALISSVFPDLEGAGVFADYEDTPNPLEPGERSDFRYGDLPFAVSVQPPVV